MPAGGRSARDLAAKPGMAKRYGTTCGWPGSARWPSSHPGRVGPAQAVDERGLVHGQHRRHPQIGRLHDPGAGGQQLIVERVAPLGLLIAR